MSKEKPVKEIIRARDTEITVLSYVHMDDYISLTDIAKYRDAENPRFIIQNWMRNRNTVEFLGLWEALNNPDFNRVDFEAVKKETGFNGIVLTPSKRVKSVNPIGLTFKTGRHGGGNLSHKDIVFVVSSLLFPRF